LEDKNENLENPTIFILQTPDLEIFPDGKVGRTAQGPFVVNLRPVKFDRGRRRAPVLKGV
jgi:hypothetical protein